MRVFSKIQALACAIIGVTLCIAPSFAAPATSNRCLRLEVLKALAEHASQHDYFRTPEMTQSWVEYKNSPNPVPQTIDLSSWCLREACPVLERTLPSKVEAQRTQYEHLLIGLKQGDTVVFDGRSFKLGKFLGAGNTTHIYEIQGTNQAIRLPYLTDNYFIDGAVVGDPQAQSTRLQKIRSFVTTTFQHLRKKKGAVKIYHLDPHDRFMLVEKIQGKQNGTSFLKSIQKSPTQELDQNQGLTFPSPRFKQVSELTPLENQKLQQLLQLMIENQEGVQSKWGASPGKFSFSSGAPRQYIWDEAHSKWVVVDAESPNAHD